MSKAITGTTYIFIDECGDLGERGSSHFTVVALSVYDRLRLARIIKKARQRILGKALSELKELKANNSTDRTRKFVLSSLGRCDCRISAVVIPKDRMHKDLFGAANRFYNYLCGILFHHISLDTDHVEIIVDKRHSNRILREDFDRYIIRRIQERAYWVTPTILHMESYASNELQVADFVAWAVNRKFSNGECEYYDLFCGKITNQGKEMLWE